MFWEENRNPEYDVRETIWSKKNMIYCVCLQTVVVDYTDQLRTWSWFSLVRSNHL